MAYGTPRLQGPHAQDGIARQAEDEGWPSQAFNPSRSSCFRRARQQPQQWQSEAGANDCFVNVAGSTRQRPSTRATARLHAISQHYTEFPSTSPISPVSSYDRIPIVSQVSPAAMSYRDYPHAQRSLIDLIPTHHDDVDASDEEDDFYSKEDDQLINPKLQALITQTSNRVPRRLQRCVVIVIAVAFVFLTSWKAFLGPRHAAQLQELKDMDEAPTMSYGSNVRPEFKGMIQIRDMDSQHLPKKGHRLVFVGDVHGCREELEHLLKKVNFEKKHDHLVLTGDMIAKGPDSPGVISLAEKLGASCVRGNWEDKLLLSIAESESRHLDTLPGPDESPDRKTDFLDEASHSHGDYALRKLAKSFSKHQITYLQQCPVILRIGNVPNLGEFAVVHAGLVPDISLENQDPFHVMNMRTIDLKTRIPSSKHAGTPWEKFWNHQQKKKAEHDRLSVVYGHNRKRGLNLQEFTFGLDSGCVSGGKLTALVVDHKGKTEIVQVKCHQEKGWDDKD
ncbi:ser/thr protein phosphatase family (calcineurin-like phosphoesterase) [Stagonosporopsis vannaccii]|nr:ser/thr protein phosphatase family (calcineurin-like phosphoesterase) [Stagonosporopsis vannaccii]